MCCVDTRTLSHCIRSGRFPPHLALHFRLLEAAWLESTIGHSPAIPIVPVHLFSKTSHD